MNSSNPLEEALRALRQDFDRSFTLETREDPAEELDFLAIRVAGDPYALRLSEVASLHTERKVVAAPSLLPELRGMAGFRGLLTPVYDLGALFGYPGCAASPWLVVAQSPSPIAFAFQAFEAHLRVPRAQISLAERDGITAVTGSVHDAGQSFPLLHLPSLVAGIAQRIKALGPTRNGEG